MLLAARDSVLIPSPSSTPEFRRGPQRLSACFVWRGQGEWKTENTKQKTENRSLALPIFHFRFSVSGFLFSILGIGLRAKPALKR